MGTIVIVPGPKTPIIIPTVTTTGAGSSDATVSTTALAVVLVWMTLAAVIAFGGMIFEDRSSWQFGGFGEKAVFGGLGMLAATPLVLLAAIFLI